MTVSGFSGEAVRFFKELKANNERRWFDANRARYDQLVLAPSLELVGALREPLARLTPPLKAEPKTNGSIRRIHRDARFSKDKAPYHTHLHLVFWTGEHPNRAPGVHVVVADDHFGFGAGHWAFDAAGLQRYRTQVLPDGGAEVAGAVAGVRTMGVELDAPALARAPAGLKAHGRAAEWLRYKGLVVKSPRNKHPPELFGPDAADFVLGLCAGLAPLNRYLVRRVFARRWAPSIFDER